MLLSRRIDGQDSITYISWRAPVGHNCIKNYMKTQISVYYQTASCTISVLSVEASHERGTLRDQVTNE